MSNTTPVFEIEQATTAEKSQLAAGNGNSSVPPANRGKIGLVMTGLCLAVFLTGMV